MKIKKIKSIKSYKSFVDFEWSKFCKNASGQEAILSPFSIVFGENGAGKSAVCDILKSVAQKQNFLNKSPTLAEIEIKNGNNVQVIKYENGNWSNQVSGNSFLFFDVDFVNANVHTHGVRSNNLQQGAHTQKAGKLIIDLDEQADNFKKAVKVKKDEVELFQKICTDILAKQFSKEDQKLFKLYENTDEKTRKEKIVKGKQELRKIELDLTILQRLNKKHTEIGQINFVSKVVFPVSLPNGETITELFAREIKEKAQNEAGDKIKKHFEKHKRFIEYAKDQISQEYKDENCPLCMQPLANATQVIEYYRSAFDLTYENAKRKYLLDIQAVKSSLESLKNNLALLLTKATAVFDALEKIKANFDIQDSYKMEEKTEHIQKFKDVSNVEVDNLLIALESLKTIDRKQVEAEAIYAAIIKRLEEIKKAIKSLNNLITAKNKIIANFKNKYSNQSKITSEIQLKNQKKSELEELTEFLKSEKVELIKKQNEAKEEQRKLSEELKMAQDELENYLANTIPENVINQMIAILEIFSLNFNLEHIKPTPNTRDYPFSFKIKDQKENEREFKEGLSEGERQLISIAFFFAINKKLTNKDRTVLIFDDPITSLDSPNLKILAKLIHKQTQEFSQVIVFTHHPLFFKYLAKCVNPCPYKFGVLKNSDLFGGSFIFFDPGFNLETEVQECNEEINRNAQRGSLKPEEIALRYGQLLRLAIEKFVKNDLLMWDKERKFDEVTERLKQGKNRIARLSNEDLELMSNMYKYCNYSNLLHSDKEVPSALSELQTHIDKFVKILNKANIGDI